MFPKKPVLSFLFTLLFQSLLLLPSPLWAQEDDFFADDPLAVPASTSAAPPAPTAPTAPATTAAPSEANPESADASAEAQARGNNYLVWMAKSLGWFFTPVFVLLSITMVALAVMNILAVRRSTLAPEDLVSQFGKLLDEAKYQEAYQLARDDPSLLGKVLSTGLARMPSGYNKALQAMQDVGQEETMRLEHQIGYLSLIGNLAPMIGLFGTVVGMIAAFQVIAAGGAAPSPQKLAEGIATALFTTEVGLAIALPSLAIYDLLKNRLTRLLLEIGIISDNFMDRFSNITIKKQN